MERESEGRRGRKLIKEIKEYEIEVRKQRSIK
jgi:hypothetical protein